MNTTTKKLALFSLASSLGTIVSNTADDDAIKWKGQKLQEAGEHAVFHCTVKLDGSKLKQVKDKIGGIYNDGDEIDVLGALLFLLCGLTDLNEHGSDSVVLDVLIRRVVWLSETWDSKLDKTDMYNDAITQYERWAK